MLQFHWYLRVGSDPCHFANFANDVSQNVPRTTKTELDAGFHSTRSRERKRSRTSSQNASKIVPESSKITPQSSQRALEELHRAPEDLQRASQEPPDLPTEPPSSSQGLSKVRPKGLQGTFREAFWNDLGVQIQVSEPMLAQHRSGVCAELSLIHI